MHLRFRSDRQSLRDDFPPKELIPLAFPPLPTEVCKMDESKEKTGVLRSLVACFVVAVLVMVAVLGSGAVSFNAVAASSTTDIDIELVPSYREVTYTLDPIVIPQ